MSSAEGHLPTAAEVECWYLVAGQKSRRTLLTRISLQNVQLPTHYLFSSALQKCPASRCQASEPMVTAVVPCMSKASARGKPDFTLECLI